MRRRDFLAACEAAAVQGELEQRLTALHARYGSRVGAPAAGAAPATAAPASRPG